MVTSNWPRRRWTASAAFMVVAACGGHQTQTTVEPAGNTDTPNANATVSVSVTPAGNTDTPNATVALSVTRINSDCLSRDERRCAEVDAIRQLLFVGVPGTNRPRAMIRNEAAATAEYQRFFEDLLEGLCEVQTVIAARSET